MSCIIDSLSLFTDLFIDRLAIFAFVVSAHPCFSVVDWRLVNDLKANVNHADHQGMVPLFLAVADQQEIMVSGYVFPLFSPPV